MVNLVDSTLHLGHGYKEINQELARENGELRQQIAILSNEYVQRLDDLRAQITYLTVQNTDLKEQVKNLMVFKQKCDAVATILLNQQPPQASIAAPTTPTVAVQQIRPSALSAGEIDDIDDGDGTASQQIRDNNTQEREKGSHVASEPEHNRDMEDNQSDPEELEELDRIGGTPARTLDPIAEQSGEEQSTLGVDVTYNDSLDPSVNSSVPTFRRDTISQTPSAYHALDSINPAGLQNSGPKRTEATNCNSANITLMNPGSPIRPINRNGNMVMNPDMFQSTPVQIRTSPGSRFIPMPTEISKVVPRADDKENMISVERKDDTCKPKATESPKPRGKKRQPAKREAAVPADSEPARYNLRKRTKRII